MPALGVYPWRLGENGTPLSLGYHLVLVNFNFFFFFLFFVLSILELIFGPLQSYHDQLVKLIFGELILNNLCIELTLRFRLPMNWYPPKSTMVELILSILLNK